MRLKLAALTAALFTVGVAAQAAPELPVVTLTLKDHRFTPESVEVPAGQPVRIELINLDAASEEFDSLDLQIEKDVTPKGRVSFVVGPLTPGVYSFIGELHADTAHGEIKAIAAN
ncbi:cupredoxin domain-containing protein [soil metagenome]